jgi:leucyl-tRNA synthetase
MDTFVNSSWYYLRYCDSKNDKKIFDEKKANYWCPIDTYIGGAEHACMHLIYIRFYTKFLRDLGLIHFDEPAKKTFSSGDVARRSGEKMSKSKGNVVVPEKVSDVYGIDTARFFLSSLASPDKDIDWNEKGIVGSLRFVYKILKVLKK